MASKILHLAVAEEIIAIKEEIWMLLNTLGKVKEEVY